MTTIIDSLVDYFLCTAQFYIGLGSRFVGGSPICQAYRIGEISLHSLFFFDLVDASANSSTTHTFSSDAFKHAPINLTENTLLKPPTSNRWTIKSPLVSHVTRIKGSAVLSAQDTSHRYLVDSKTISQTTVSFKSIASTQKVCPVDQLPDFQSNRSVLFNVFADSIRTELPNARGFDIIVQQLVHTSQLARRASGPSQQTACLSVLKGALQQAINVQPIKDSNAM